MKVISEIFQKRLHQALEGLEGVCCSIHDDVIIWGRTDGEHDVRVRTFLKCCVDEGITLSKEKCRFDLNKIPFMGHVLTSDGLKPDRSKVEAVQKVAPPQDKAAVVERLRGTVNYLSDVIHAIYRVSQKFVPLISCTITFDQKFIFT